MSRGLMGSRVLRNLLMDDVNKNKQAKYKKKQPMNARNVREIFRYEFARPNNMNAQETRILVGSKRCPSGKGGTAAMIPKEMRK
jgi:hypothetical protein